MHYVTWLCSRLLAPNALCATHSSPTSALLDALCYMTIELTFEKSVLHTAHLAPKVCCIVILHSVRVCMHNTVCCVCMHNTLCDMTIELTLEKSVLHISHLAPKVCCIVMLHSVLCMYAQHTVWHDYRADVGEECVAHSAFGAKSLLYSHVTQCAVYVCTTHCVTWL